VQPCYEDDGDVFSAFPFNGAPVELNWQGKTEVLGENTVPVPICPPQIPHGLNPGLRGERPATNRLSHGTALRWFLTRYRFIDSKRSWQISLKILAFPLSDACKVLWTKLASQMWFVFIWKIERRKDKIQISTRHFVRSWCFGPTIYTADWKLCTLGLLQRNLFSFYKGQEFLLNAVLTILSTVVHC
jgi:hypothetical protein